MATKGKKTTATRRRREKKNIEYVTLLIKGQSPISKAHYLSLANTLYEERGE